MSASFFSCLLVNVELLSFFVVIFIINLYSRRNVDQQRQFTLLLHDIAQTLQEQARLPPALNPDVVTNPPEPPGAPVQPTVSQQTEQ